MADSGLLFCTGAPLDRKEDREYALCVKEWKGKKIVSGGTTAKIISRELKRTITVLPNARGVTLPIESRMLGINIVSEGVITLSCVRRLLEHLAENSSRTQLIAQQSSVDKKIVYLLLSHRNIKMIIGTRLNEAHLDPTLPYTLERRVDIMHDIAKILREEFRKNVEIVYY